MKGFICLAIALFFAFYPFSPGRGVESPGGEELFYKANRAYNEGRFQDAIMGYLRLVEEGHESGHLHYNLGNAYFRLKNLGRAILSYERARLLLPRDEDVNFNLRYVLEQTQDALPESRSLVSQTFFWLDDVELDELFWAFAVLNFLVWTTLGFRLFRRPEWTYYVLVLFLGFWLTAGLSLGLKWYQRKTDHRAVILSEQVNVLAGPHVQDTVLFRLHQGAVVRYERSEDGWTLVYFSEEKRGWVKTQTIAKIARSSGADEKPSPLKEES